ncbi:hypothetical protein RSSM_00417 [Rhodopirellula sallentina SM41]|uniref:Uncharacterized protein n=1 Tax=Rhodopirellula sallentina SM41 TaxID=1263870 RepID=M5U9M5_9BACT|nr:hypothetical protein RSSM_00417 [Rhodopirellula sallentina SM41]
MRAESSFDGDRDDKIRTCDLCTPSENAGNHPLHAIHGVSDDPANVAQLCSPSCSPETWQRVAELAERMTADELELWLKVGESMAPTVATDAPSHNRL